MGYLAVLAANIFVSAPLAILVVAYSHLGTYGESAKLGTALAYIGPLYLLLSMQHGVGILSGNRTPGQVAAIRLKSVPAFMLTASAIAWALGEPMIVLAGAFRLADFLYEPYFYGRMQAQDRRALVLSSLGRLLAFVTALAITQLVGFDLYAAMMIMVLVNSVVTLKPFFRVFESISESSVSGVDFLLGAAACLASITMNIPRYFLVRAEPSQLAAYSNILTLVMAGTLLFISFNNSFLAKYAQRGWIGIRSFYWKSTVLFFLAVIGSGGFLLGDDALARIFVRYVLGSAYLDFYRLIFPFSLLYCFLYLQNVINNVFVYLRVGKITVICNIVLILLFVFGFQYSSVSMTAERAILVADVAMAIFLVFAALSSVMMLRDGSPVRRAEIE